MKKIFNIFLVLFVLSLFSVSAIAIDTANVKATILNQDPDPAKPGEYLEIRLKVEKTGNDPVENMQFKLETEYPFYFDKSDSPDKNIGTWRGISENEWYYTLYYKLRVDKDALEDTYEMDLKYRYNNQDIWSILNFDVRVGENKEPKFALGNLVTSPIKLVNDLDEAELKFELMNIGDGDAENVVANLELPKGFSQTYSYSTTQSIGSLDSSQSKYITYYVDIDKSVVSNNYKAKLNLRYQEDDDEDKEYKTKVMELDIFIKEKPDFEIKDIEFSKENIYPTDKIDMKINLKNIGTKDADSVSVRLFKDSSQPFDLKEKSDFIGDLKINESGDASLTIEIDKEAMPKKYILDLEIRSIKNDSVYIQDKTISFEVLEKEDSSIILEIIIGIVILGLVIGISYNAGSKKILKKENFKIKKK